MWCGFCQNWPQKHNIWVAGVFLFVTTVASAMRLCKKCVVGFNRVQKLFGDPARFRKVFTVDPPPYQQAHHSMAFLVGVLSGMNANLMKKYLKNKHMGSSFNGFLKEQGIYDEVRSRALKEFIASLFKEEMKKQKITKAEMARRMKTSRSSVGRFLDPENGSLSICNLIKAADALGKEIEFRLR